MASARTRRIADVAAYTGKGQRKLNVCIKHLREFAVAWDRLCEWAGEDSPGEEVGWSA
jgi:hypothetical protein